MELFRAYVHCTVNTAGKIENIEHADVIWTSIHMYKDNNIIVSIHTVILVLFSPKYTQTKSTKTAKDVLDLDCMSRIWMNTLTQTRTSLIWYFLRHCYMYMYVSCSF